MARPKSDSHPIKERPPYARYAFHNLYNYTLLGGIASAALLTQNWWLAVLGGGLETLWMVFAPDARPLQKLWFDKVYQAELAEANERDRQKRLAGLPLDAAARVRRLEQLRSQIRKLAAQNKAFAQQMLTDELARLDQLVASFLDLMQTSLRHEDYLHSVDIDELEGDLERYQALVEKTPDDERRRIAEKNLTVLEKRREKLAELRRFVAKARGQLDLIENTFRLLADQIVTMESPRELTGQLDELRDGVEAVQSTAREAAHFIEALER